MPAAGERAYVVGLKLLATRELAEGQLRERLTRRQFDATEVDEAIARLKGERALDDRRTAGAYARTEANVRGRGRLRVLRHLHSMGIAPEIARQAVDEAFGELDESLLIERVLERRLRPGESPRNPKVAVRLHRYLIAQGFDFDQIRAALGRRRHAGIDVDDGDDSPPATSY
jgi:regulatory protein